MAYIKEVRGYTPRVGEGTFVAETAVLIGDVTVGRDSSIWFNTVLRGDVNSITVGDRTNIQDGTVIHTLYDGAPHPSQTHIGNDVSIGHNATIHGAIIEDNCLIGMGATVLDNAVVASGCIVARRRAGVVGRETRTRFGLCRRPGPQGQGDYARTTRRDHPAHRPRLPYVRLVVRGGQIAVR